MSLVTIEIWDSHLYPGALGTASGLNHAGGERACLVVFADGAAVGGSIRAMHPADFTLDVSPYVTARGTRIPSKSWLVAVTSLSDGTAALRVRKRL